MRTFVALLLLANLALFAYVRLEQLNDGEPGRLSAQLAPEKVKLLTPSQVANLGPGKVAQLANVCLEWGAFTDAERTAALAALEPLHLGKQMSQRRVESTSSFWVFIPPLTTRQLVERKIGELKALGLNDYYVLNDGPSRNAISLGIFKSEEAASKFHESIRARGVNTARIGPRNQAIAQTVLILRDPQPAQADTLQQLKTDFAGSDVKIGPCDKA